MAIVLQGRRIQMIDEGTGRLLPFVLPELPTITVTAISDTINRITGSPEGGADSLDVEVSSAVDGPWSALVDNLDGTYDHAGLTAESTWHYRPTATNLSGDRVGNVVSRTTLASGTSVVGDAALTVEKLSGHTAHGAKLKLTTDGTYSFGPDVGAVAAWAFGDDWRLEGVKDTFLTSVTHGELISSNAQTVFRTLGDYGAALKSTAEKRHSRLASSIECRLTASQTNLNEQDNMVMWCHPQGRFGSGTEVPYHRYQFHAWRTKYQARHGIGYVRVKVTALPDPMFNTGNDAFDFGEWCTCTKSDGTSFQARIQHIDPTTLATYYWNDGGSATDLYDMTIKGNETGAIATVISQAENDGNYVSRSNLKEYRLNNYSVANSSSTVNKIGATGSGAGYNTSQPFFRTGADEGALGLWSQYSGINPEGWIHTRLIVDRKTGFRFFLNGDFKEKLGDMDAYVGEVDHGLEALVGLEDNGDIHAKGWLNEHYTNDTLFVVYLSNSSTASGIDWGNVEYQHINYVLGNESEVEINRGAYADSEQVYVYICNDFTGLPRNANGVAI